MSDWLELDASRMRPAELVPPLSKSDALRALALARITGVEVPDFGGEMLPRDVRILRKGWEDLNRARRTGAAEILACADGGAPFRILLAQAASSKGHVFFTGAQRLGERPHGPLYAALREALGPVGLKIRVGAPWPVEVKGAEGRGEPRFRVDAAESSQFATALLLAGAALQRREERPWAVELQGPPVASTGYLELTVRWLERAGFALSRIGRRLEILEWHRPSTASSIPGDWSSIAYLLLVAWRAKATVSRVDPAADHPDQAVVRLLESVGLRAEIQEGHARVRGRFQRGLRASAVECPDLAPTLAAVACMLPEPSELEGVGILRGKESDRLEGIRALVAAAGGTTRLAGDSLTLEPPAQLPPQLVFDSRGDHRLAMSAATLAVLGERRLRISEPRCVEKSFPGFWGELAKAGVAFSGAVANDPHPSRLNAKGPTPC